jgi:DNA-binding CsgD family transcriptional regulator/PAS domain-containing protein
MDTHDSLLRIVGEIYASVGRAERWTACLESIGALLQGTAANLLYHDHHSHHGGIAASTIDPSANQAYAQYFHSVDPWALSVTPGTYPPEQIILGQSLVPHHEMMRTEFYADFAQRLGVTRVIVGVIEASPNRVGVVSVNRSDSSPEFDGEAVRILGALVPHVRRALDLHRRLVTVAAEHGALREVMDRFRAAVLLLNRAHDVVLMNRAANQLTAKPDGLAIEQRRVKGATPAATAALTQAIGSAVAVACGETTDVGRWRISLPRPSGSHPRDVLVVPLVHADLGAPVAALFITDPNETPALPARELTVRYALTPAEARVASALAQGRSVKEIADTLRLSEQTTRWYVKQVLAKTGTTTQAQVVRLLLSITAALVHSEES